MDQFSSKVILITGASSGVGAEIARGFAKYKASLSITGRNEANLEKVAEECKELGASQVLSIINDVKKKESLEETMRKTIEAYGKLDVLVNNAGISKVEGIKEITWEEFDHMIGTNLKSAVFLTQMAIPYLKKTKGNVVNISSIASSIPWPVSLGYTMSKSAMDQLTKTAALELSGKGIRVNAVNPGMCKTNLCRCLGISEEEKRKLYEVLAKDNPLEQKPLTVENVADAVLFLASDSANMITGATLRIDGGSGLVGKPIEQVPQH